MTARFKKVHHVNQLNEPEDELDDELDEDFEVQIETHRLINEEVESREAGSSHNGCASEDLNSFLPVTSGERRWQRVGWKVWKRKMQQPLNSIPAPTERVLNVCGCRCRRCHVNSWRAVFLALFVFSTAMVMSVLLSRLLAQPLAKPQGEGNFLSSHTYFSCSTTHTLHSYHALPHRSSSFSSFFHSWLSVLFSSIFFLLSS